MGNTVTAATRPYGAWRSPITSDLIVDASGAVDLSRGLGSPIQPGLIYAGLAGATRWPWTGIRTTC